MYYITLLFFLSLRSVFVFIELETDDEDDDSDEDGHYLIIYLQFKA